MDENKAIKELDKLISEFIERSTVFVQYSCYLPGLKDLKENHKTIRHVYDHEYLAFTKSTKTLISIKNLLELGNNEDVFILIRSIFENYLAARYLNENVHTIDDLPKLDEYIQNRIKIVLGYYSVKKGKVLDENGQQVAKLRNIKSQLVGMDELYYNDFYGFLSRFTHLDFSELDYYINEHASFVLNKENDPLLARLFTVFVITKVFEAIVTINGEDFYDEEEEKKCYNIVIKSLIAQRRIFKEYISAINFHANDDIVARHRVNLQNMLINMNNSLLDNIGDLNKASIF
ncbi:DUF5677 domain-containing protein [Cytobacillus kochii]|uniref:DUF5677 domain-containing protein n=1 Tax=Cytobacillus kochii TaxID=859143 RepID=UPI0025A0BC4F|nr:DUF5677 domain-containing protein [Cytobacillus kochii]MDM5209216.1 DUF5677 domain-containing protein [Cytobacillus kochii]